MTPNKKEALLEIVYDSSWDGTCGTCGASVCWSWRYGNMDNMRRTYCGDLSIKSPYYNNLIYKNSHPKWCPRKKEMKKLVVI